MTASRSFFASWFTPSFEGSTVCSTLSVMPSSRRRGMYRAAFLWQTWSIPHKAHICTAGIEQWRSCINGVNDRYATSSSDGKSQLFTACSSLTSIKSFKDIGKRSSSVQSSRMLDRIPPAKYESWTNLSSKRHPMRSMNSFVIRCFLSSGTSAMLFCSKEMLAQLRILFSPST